MKGQIWPCATQAPVTPVCPAPPTACQRICGVVGCIDMARTFASEREQLESRWASGNEVSTEDLRRGLRRYRSFFERLLAA